MESPTKKAYRALRMGRYWNANGQACTVVATLTVPVDWAAYIGGVPDGDTRSEVEAVAWVAKHGCKLSESDARHFFPTIDLPYRG